MALRPLKNFSTLTLAAVVALVASSALAQGKKDKEALKLHDQAMDTDYLSVEFDKAEDKLKKALKACGKDACSPEVLGKIHVALATVHGVGQQKLDVAKADLVNALKANPGAKLIDGLSTPELEAKFKEAQAEVGGGAGGAGGAGEGGSGEGGSGEGAAPATPVGGDFDHTPIPEQTVNYPVPVFAEIPDDLGAEKVVIRYKAYGGSKWESLPLTKIEGGFGGEIPCKAVTTTGDLRYYIIGSDAGGTPVATAGSTKQPFKVTIKNKIEGDAPSLPGKPPPQKCPVAADCPPGLEGCGPSGRGGKVEGSICDQTQECAEGLICLNSVCEIGTEETPEGPSVGAHHFISVGAQFDLAYIAGGEDVCSASQSASYVCFAGDNQFYGDPADVNGTNGISGGLGFGGIRVLAGYDYFFDFGLGLGGRVGFAFLGSPSSENTRPNGDVDGDDEPDYAVPPTANSFLPVHAEARASWRFLSGNMQAGQIRPHVFVSGGVAQVNASVPVTVCDLASEGEGTAECPGRTSVDAYQLTGLSFVGFGGGGQYMFIDNFGVNVELKFMVMFPTTGFVISPTVSPVLAF